MSEIVEAAKNPRRWLILIVLCLATLVLVVDNMALTVALPPMAEDLKATPQDLQWVLESYMLVFAGLLLTTGSLSDRFGRRKVMLIGLILFGVASLAATFVQNPAELIAARVAMGVGGALIMPSTLSILITVFDEKERPKAMSVWGAVAMVGLVGGPVLGGFLIAHFDWTTVFFINVPIAVLAIIAALVLMPESKGPWKKADPIGMVLSIIGMAALVWTINELPKGGLSEGRNIAVGCVALVSLAAFVLWELKAKSPMVPLKLFRNRNFSGGSFSLVLVQIGNGGLLLVFTQYLQFVLDYTPTEAGLSFIPLALASLAFNGIGAGLVAKLGYRIVLAIGLVMMAGGFFYLSTVKVDSGFVTAAVGLFILGAAAGLSMPAAIGALMGAVPPEEAGVGSALNDTIQQAGAALGVAALGSLVATVFSGNMPAGTPKEATHSISDAFGVAALTGDSGLIGSARAAFVDSMHATFLIAMTGTLAAALVALIVLKSKKQTDAEAAELAAKAEAEAGAPAAGHEDLVAAV